MSDADDAKHTTNKPFSTAPTVLGAVVGALAGRAVGGMLFGRLGGNIGLVAGAILGGKKAQEMADGDEGFNPFRTPDEAA